MYMYTYTYYITKRVKKVYASSKLNEKFRIVKIVYSYFQDIAIFF